MRSYHSMLFSLSHNLRKYFLPAMSRSGSVKNRAPAPIQVTAEQLLREAKEKQLEVVDKAPKQFITDKEELQLYQQGKRKDFEDDNYMQN